MLVCQAMENSVDTVMILYNFIGPGLGDRALMYLDVMGLMEYTGTTNGQYEPWHEISNNVVCATSKASDQPAQMRSLIRAFACCLNIL